MPHPEPRRPFADGRILLDREGGIATIRFNHPDKHNAMSVEMWEGLAEALCIAGDDASVRVLVLTGEGGKAFVSGGDISQFEATHATEATRAEMARRAGAWRRLLADFPRPTLAAIRGWCIGGGLALALGADLRLAARNSHFGIPATRLGLAYPFEGLRALTQLVGPAWARQLLFTAGRIDADEALRIGLVNRLAEPEALDAAVAALAAEIAANAPLAVAAARIGFRQLQREPDERDMDAVALAARRCTDSEDLVEGRRAFMEKRTPRFAGR